jgi:hypothetical protein
LPDATLVASGSYDWNPDYAGRAVSYKLAFGADERDPSYMPTPRITVRHEELHAHDILDVANGRGDDTGTPAWMRGVVTTTVHHQHSRDRMS